MKVIAGNLTIAIGNSGMALQVAPVQEATRRIMKYIELFRASDVVRSEIAELYFVVGL